MVKARMSHQMVMSNFPTGRMVGKVGWIIPVNAATQRGNSGRGESRSSSERQTLPANPGAPSLRSENLLAWPMKARHGPPRVGTMIWASRAALGAGGRDATDTNF
jgi:hypothetical protein